MAHVQAVRISHSFGDRDVLQNVTLPIAPGTRTALSGDNGSGKSTLLKIIAGIVTPDSGQVIRQKNTVISYLPQDGVVHLGSSLMHECEGAFGRFASLLAEKKQIENRLASAKEGDSSIESDLQRQHEIEETLIDASYDRREEQIQRVLGGLGFHQNDYQRDTHEFSGGWQMRIALAKVLLEKPDVLLLDEPTNYLDMEARNWLERFLAEYHGGIVLVSHDRYFLDVTVTAVAELFGASLQLYPGNYSAYLTKRALELKTLLTVYRKQQDEILKLNDFIRRFRSNASKAAQVQSRITRLNAMELTVVPESLKRIRIVFPKSPHSGKIVLRAKELSKSYDEVSALRDVSFQLERGEKMVITGVNGAGKSTLMRILSGRERNFGGRLVLGTDVKAGYFSQEINELDDTATVLEEAEASAPASLMPKLKNLLGAFLFRGDDVFKRVSVLSGGERNRLALLKLLLNPVNLLILDEPTNHLDMASKQVLLDALESFDGTLIFVSHDRYFIEDLANRVLELTAGSGRIFPGDYPYYLWKTGQEDQDETRHAPQDRPVRNSGRTDHEEKKKIKSDLRRFEREEHAIMTRLEELEHRHELLVSELADPAIYADGQKARDQKEKIEKNEREQDLLSEQWHDLEALRAKIQSGGSDGGQFEKNHS